MPSQAKTVNQMGNQNEQCIQYSLDCHRICQETIMYCLDRGGDYASALHIRVLLDCADICLTNASFIIRASDKHSTISSSCAETCLHCAEVCEVFADDECMKSCAAACRRCAEYCQLMVANTAQISKV
jgi:hypothetical protein